MFDQLTWATGMFTETAIVVIALMYVFRNNYIVEALIFDTERNQQLSSFSRSFVPGLTIAVLYLIELFILWWAWGQQDSSAMDWAVVVLLLGVLLAGPMAGIFAGAFALPVRAAMLFNAEADSQSLADVSTNGWFATNPDFWLNETWIWWQPGVIQLFAAIGLATLAFRRYQGGTALDYPMWIGLPLAIGTQVAFVLAAWWQWGPGSAQSYLKSEAIPAAAALALAVFIFVLVLSACRSDYERRRKQLAELDAAQEQLRFLNAQINPHFLNNSLSAISGIMQQSPQRAQNLLGELGDYFRGVCATTETMTSLEKELTLVKSYVRLEQARFGERLEVNYAVKEDCLTISIPRMTLQPLVENAIKHGISSTNQEGMIQISAQQSDQQLILQVRDNGNGLMQPLRSKDFGTGLSNVHQRLRRIYADHGNLEIDSEWGKGTCATIRIDLCAKSIEPQTPAKSSQAKAGVVTSASSQ